MADPFADIRIVDEYGNRWLNFNCPVKRCSRCERWLAHGAFSRNRRAPDGLRYSCKECCSGPQKRRRLSVRQKPPLTAERLRELFLYSPNTGLFIRRIATGSGSAGAVAGCVRADGYRSIGIDGRTYGAGRLAIMFITGDLPVNEVDHWNLDKADDRFDNLRVATRGQNEANKRAMVTNKLGVKGVRRNRRKFRACIQVNGHDRSLGSFSTIAEASMAYEAAAVAAWGEFARPF
jgi:hypothetical protein